MFPIRDHNPSGRLALVTWALIAANGAVFLAGWFTLQGEVAQEWLFFTWGLVPETVLRGERAETLVTSMFLHGGWMHLLGNMWFLWIFGDNMEEALGPLRFLGFYLLSGLAAAFAQVASAPYSPFPMVGASGAVAGVMGGYLLLFPRARVDVLFIFIIFFRILPVPAWIVLGVWIGVQLFNGASMPLDGGGVAWWAHVGGFAGGMVLALPAFLRRGGTRFWSATHGVPPHPEARNPLARSHIPRVPRR